MKKPVKIAAALMLTAALSLSTFTSFAYQNGTSIDNQWASSTVEYGIGDPYIMKYNGMFYLYCSTFDGQMGIKVWSSPDMVNWTYEGLCSSDTDQVMKTAYAPEVTYWNGTFYMYTAAPGGDQHRVLTSDSPTGPFVREETPVFSDPEDLIDGSVFIDDDEAATKYFLHAGGSCIEYGILNDNMLTATGKNQISAATVIGHWTEGPSIFKRNGKYYMTYCGNHVLADNYMIEYVAGDSVTSMKEPEENLLLINTEEGITGLGHNSSVVGPDLDSRYIVYHNLVSNTNAPERRLNIDRMVFNGEKLEVQGPTWWEMDNPKMPEFYDRMENGNNWDTIAGTGTAADNVMTLTGSSELRSKDSTPSDYTAEFNLAVSDYAAGSQAGAVVSYQNDQNYAFVYFTPQDNTLHFDAVVNGETVVSETANLPDEYTYGADVLRKLTVKKEGETFDIYADDRLLITADAALSGGQIGLKTVDCTAGYGYTAFSSTVNGNQDKDTVKPTGSAMDAVHANSASRDFETGTITESGAGLDSHYVEGMTAGDSVTFKINPEKTSYYSAEILARAQAGATVSLSVDGKEAASDVELTQSEDFFTDVVRNIAISESAQEITLTVTEGTMDLYSLKLDKSVDIFEESETQENMDYEWLDGAWSDTIDTISTTDSSVWSTASYGSEHWGDYEYEGDVSLRSGSDAGLLVRLNYATDSSDSKSGIGGCNSADYHYGYYAYINTSGVALGKQMFNWKVLASNNRSMSTNRYYNLRVRAEGANIKVWLDDELVIDYTDTEQPIMSGKVGLRAMNAYANYQNLALTHLNVAEPLSDPVTLTEGATPITKTTFQVYSNAQGKGFELKDGGIDFNNGNGRSVKGYMTQNVALDGTVSCDITLPGTGGLGVGLLVRCKPDSFGEGVDALDGLGVQFERAAGGSVDVRAYSWDNGVWQGTLATQNIPNFFTDQQPRTVHFAVETNGNELTAYVDGEECLTMDISQWSDASRTAVGFRAHHAAHVMLTNFTFSGEVLPDPDPETVSVSLDTDSIEVGDTANASATVTPADADQSVTWSSSDEDVATVDQNGVVTGVSEGTATITATASNGVTGSAQITVTKTEEPAPSDPEAVAVTLDADSIEVGDTANASATVTPADADQSVTWSSSDEDVATVDQNGVVTGVSEGTATITATASNGVSGSAPITVTEAEEPGTPSDPDDGNQSGDSSEPDGNDPGDNTDPGDSNDPGDNNQSGSSTGGSDNNNGAAQTPGGDSQTGGQQGEAPQTGDVIPVAAGVIALASLCGAVVFMKKGRK